MSRVVYCITVAVLVLGLSFGTACAVPIVKRPVVNEITFRLTPDRSEYLLSIYLNRGQTLKLTYTIVDIERTDPNFRSFSTRHSWWDPSGTEEHWISPDLNIIKANKEGFYRFRFVVFFTPDTASILRSVTYLVRYEVR
jgi:hypothetical protein